MTEPIVAIETRWAAGSIRTAFTPGCERRNCASSSAQLSADLAVKFGGEIGTPPHSAGIEPRQFQLRGVRKKPLVCGLNLINRMIGLTDESAVPPPPESHAPELAAKIFAEGGWLEERLGLEHRLEQDQMGRATAAAFRDDAALLFEAGTGVGKSLAYLVPGIIHAVDQRRPLIVSTHTISLQEQIETKDLPLCRRLFSSAPELGAYAGFKSALLLGKSNYLCTTRLAHALADRASLFADEDYAELQRIADWSEKTETGLRHDLQPPPRPEVWEAVNADSSSCARKYCDCSRCFYQRARSRLREANVIIVNHALLFALINAGRGPRVTTAPLERLRGPLSG